MAHSLEAQLLLTRDVRIMLIANLWTEVRLINGSIETIQNLLFKEDQESPSLPIAVLISFNNYIDPTISNLKGKRVVPVTGPILKKRNAVRKQIR